MNRILHVMAILGLTALAACSAFKEQAEASDEPKTVVLVQNTNVLDVNVYVLRNGQRFRLGQVITGNTETFDITQHLYTGPITLRFIADPIGSNRTILIDEFLVSPGDEIYLSVPSFRR